MADVQKLAVYDSRVVQPRPAYAIEKGALSVTNQPFQALSQSASQHTYSIQVPSETTFVDRALNWTSTVAIQQNWTFGGGIALATSGDYIRLGGCGEGWSWSAFPLQSLCTTIQATINDANVSINTSDVLKEILRLTDYAANRRQRTTPTKLDKMRDTRDDWYLADTVYGSFDRLTDRSNVPNGAFIHSSESLTARDSPYCNNAAGDFTFGAFAPVAGLPVYAAQFPSVPAATFSLTSTAACNVYLGQDGAIYIQCTAAATVSALTLYVKQTFTEKLVLSPFVFSDVHEKDVGLFGIQNIGVTMNIQSPQQPRTIRQLAGQVQISQTATGVIQATPGAVSLAQTFLGASPFSGSKIDVMFLTPPLDLPLAAKSVVPYLEYPRFLSNSQTVPATSTTSLISPTLTLSQIPDLLVIWARPQTYGATDADYYLPISKVQINFDNYSSLMGTMSAEQLYELSYNNGLDMSYPEWAGRVHTSHASQGLPVAPGSAAVVQQAGWTTGAAAPTLSPYDLTVGGPLVIKPGKDFALSTGAAPGLVGNYVLSITADVQNASTSSVNAVMYVMTINSGFFESVKGTSRIIKAPINEADVISAPVASFGTRLALERAVGGASGLFGKVGSVLGRLAPLIPDVVKAVAGEGRSGGAPARSGGAPARSGGAKSLASRLM